MFLISLIVFPFIAGYLFNQYKGKVGELNWVVKLIWLIWLLIISLLVFFDIFRRSDAFLVIVFLWYFLVFFYYYFKIIALQAKSIDKIWDSSFSLSWWILKILFFIFIIILAINLADNYEVNRSLDIFNYWSENLTSFLLTYIYVVILLGAIFEFIEMLKNHAFRMKKIGIETKSKLKQELKAEILSELKS